MMKAFRRLIALFLYILLCAIVVSCSDKDDPISSNPNPEPNPTPEETTYLLEDGVVEIKGNDLKYIVEAQDGSTLVLSDDFPSGAMPSVGEIVFVYPNAEKLAHGFLGKVSKIEQSGEKYHLITEQVALDEAFSYLEVDETIDFEPVSVDEKSASRVAVEEINGYNCLTQGVEFTFDIKKYLKLKVKGKLTLGMRIRVKTHIDDSKNKKEQVVQLSKYVSFNSTTHFTCLVDKDEIPKLEPVQFPINALKLRIPAGVVSLFACPEIVPKFIVKLDAALNVGLGNDYSSEETFTIVYKDGKWSFDCDTTTGMQKEPTLNLLPQGLISMQGSVFAGLAISPEVKLFGRDDMKISINPAVGIRGKAEINYNSETDKSLYDALKDDEFTTSLAVLADVEADAKIFKWQAKWSADLFEKDFFPVKRYLFPSFSNDLLVYNKDNVAASVKLGRDLLFPAEVGLGLYEADDCIDMSEFVPYRLEEEFSKKNPLDVTFENTSEEKKNDYSVWSFVKWGDLYIKCKQLTPKKKIKSMSMTEVSTSSLTDKYSFYYTNDSIDRIVHKESYYDDDITYKFNYLNDSTIKVIGTISDEQVVCNLKLNDDGYIKKCLHSYSGPEGSYSQTFEFEYDDDGRMTYMKRSEGNEVWRLVYNNSNAISVSCNGNKTNSISYGNLECPENWIWYGWMMGLDIDEMDIFGLIGMLGKSSKNLPTVNKGLGEEYSLHYDWSMDGYGYPDRVVIDEDGSDYVLNLSWE